MSDRAPDERPVRGDPLEPGKPRPPVNRERLNRASARAQAVADAAADQPDGSVHHTSRGTVRLGPVRIVEASDTEPAVVEVYAHGAESGDPHFRVINPPRYVPDPDGDIEINGRRFRDDPLAALAEIIGLNGGRHKGRGR